MSVPLLETRALSRGFALRRGLGRALTLRAVDRVDLRLVAGEALGIVGESGSGKSTLARMVAGLLEPSGGRILFDGTDLAGLEGAARRAWRRQVQIVFQNPHGSLDPRWTVAASIGEPLRIQERLHGRDLRARVAALLAEVGLPEPFLWRHPHELSGGQKQRVAIARALATAPRLVVLDEPTSALDVSVQAQILDHLTALRRAKGLAYLLISHNLAVVRRLCERIAVMYCGRIVEEGPTEAVMARPAHPYTRALLEAVPRPGALGLPPVALEGDPPDPAAPPSGCPFHPRCPQALARCREAEPPALEAAPGRSAACWLVADRPTTAAHPSGTGSQR